MTTRINLGLPLKAFPGGTWNEMLDRLDAIEARKPVRAQQTGIGNRSGQLECWVVPDEDIIEHGVVVFDEPAYTPAETGLVADEGEPATLVEPVLMVKKPATATLGNVVLITLEPIEADKPGRAVLVGTAIVRVDIVTVGDTTCGPIAADGDKLQSGSGNIPIIWASTSSTGVQFCLVLLGGAATATPFTCVVISSLTAAAWNNGTKTLMPAANTDKARLLTWNGSTLYGTPSTITPEWVDSEAITVASSKGRIGKGIFSDGRYQLLAISCEEIDYTEA